MYKILSLDGGGSWSIIQLETLKIRFKTELPELRGHDILKQFDLVIATSGGALALAALVENWTIEESIAKLKDSKVRNGVFCKNKWKDRYFPINITKTIFNIGPKYSSSGKYKFLKSLFGNFGNERMNDIPNKIGQPELKIIVTGYDAYTLRSKFFRSFTHAKSSQDFVTLTQAVHASSNAPLQYFDFPARFKAIGEGDSYYEMWDGALAGLNNPVFAGVIEAFKLGVPRQDMQVISLGTGNKIISTEQKQEFYKNRYKSTRNKSKKLRVWTYKYQWKFFLAIFSTQAKTILNEPVDWANYATSMFLAENSMDDTTQRFVRLSPLIYKSKEMDDTTLEIINQLYHLEMDLTTDDDIKKLESCIILWGENKILNQPISYFVNRDHHIENSLGTTNFSEAISVWTRMI